MKQMVVWSALVAFAVLPVWAADSAATGQNCPPPLGKIIKAADADSNGEVTLEEFLAKLPNSNEHRFNVLDRNNDGVLTKEDIPWEERAKVLRKLQHADTDGDGSVTFEEFQVEFPHGTQQQFDRLDRNTDGVISKDDCVPLHQPTPKS